MAPSASIVSLVDLLDTSTQKYGPRELFGTKSGEPVGLHDLRPIREAGRRDPRRPRRRSASSAATRSASSRTTASSGPSPPTRATGSAPPIVPMYEAQLARSGSSSSTTASAKVLIVATEAIFEKTKGFPTRSRRSSTSSLIARRRAAEHRRTDALLARAPRSRCRPFTRGARTRPCLIYTSGTTGNPKGVILSHGNIVSNVSAVHELLPARGDDRCLSFLPWAHSFGQTCELHGLLSMGASIGDLRGDRQDPRQPRRGEADRALRVPRIFNRIYTGVKSRCRAKPGLIRTLFKSGLKRRGEEAPRRSRSASARGLTLALADKLVFSKVRARFGGHLKYAFSGGAALSRDVAEFIDGLGITVYEGYGLTETSPIATANCPGNRKIGSVGRPIPGVRVVIDKSATGDPKHGEIVVYGPNVMQGYHNREEENDAVFTADGGFRTGDMGYLDDDGFLYITGPHQGAVQARERQVRRARAARGAAQALAVHRSTRWSTATTSPSTSRSSSPNVDAVKKWAQAHGSRRQEHRRAPRRRPRCARKMQGRARQFGRSSRASSASKFALIAEDFTPENGMLTPKLKVKRRNVMQKWGRQIEALYE